MKKLILSVLVLVASVSVFAEKADSKAENKKAAKSEAAMTIVSGNIIDVVTGEALVGVEVTVEGSDSKAYSDFDGHFTIKDVKAGECKLVANYTSYNKTEKTVELKSKKNQVKIELQASK
ncbi:MAG: carboxypeptidase-like regulatory domain-containing protein [Bacteroidota bacterium]|nr:carboxypeptidase-like regulatory domain-containing protein [Bacteroidota bacterium]